MTRHQRSHRPFAEHFANSAVNEDGCRIWAGRIDNHGYANFGARGAHRVSFETFVGPIPEGMTVDHTCFNKLCVEPSHLRLLTNLANARNHADRPGVLPENQCINGHEYTPENTYRRPRGGRDCRACIRARVKAYQLRRAAA